MAKKRNIVDKGQENVVAALDQLEASAAAVTRASGIIKKRLESLEETLMEQDTRMQEMKEEYARDKTALETRLQISEEKLRKVQQTLA